MEGDTEASHKKYDMQNVSVYYLRRGSPKNPGGTHLTTFNSSLVKGYLLIILLFVASDGQSEDKALNILNDEPVFTVSIEGSNLSYFVNLNGVAVYDEFDHSGQVSLTVPVNHFMHPEENTLAIDVVPPEPGEPYQPNASVKAELKVHNLGDADHKITLAAINFDEAFIEEGDPTRGSSKAGRFELSEGLKERSDGSIQVGEVTANPDPDYEGSVLYKRNLTVPNALPLWAFFNSDDLPDYYKSSDEGYYPELESLLKEYQKVQKALETGDIESVMPLFEERNREIDLAFYQERETTEQGMRDSILESANNGNLELTELNKNVVNMLPEDNRKLVRLIASDRKAAIGLNFIEGQGSVNYDLVFRHEDGQWILTC